ncbi:MAG: phosphoribosylanthranilate isomerase [Campylobacterota bacterium]|nr:phosphoribosylanthranilate isomerase [Campylobacterota bacterium]
MIRIKICGITNLEDAMLCISLGADALGFIFYKKSPRCVDIYKVKEICSGLPPFITKVGVFVDEDEKRLRDIFSSSGLNVVQLHGGESVNYVYNLKVLLPGVHIIKFARNMNEAEMFAPVVDSFIVDSGGGTGKVCDWEFAKNLREKISLPLILAGGLDGSNVREAIKTVHPYAVDACSKLEKEKGKKDNGKLEEFIKEVRNSEIA